MFTTCYSSTDLSLEDYVKRPKEYRRPIQPRLVFVGSLAQMYKGQDVLIRAVGLLKERQLPVELKILGAGRHRLELERLVRSLSLDGAVRFLGELPGAAVREELDNATLMVLPSRTEGLPRVVIEAMARALPCIATSVGGIPELLHQDDLVTLLVRWSHSRQKLWKFSVIRSIKRDVCAKPTKSTGISGRTCWRKRERNSTASCETLHGIGFHPALTARGIPTIPAIASTISLRGLNSAVLESKVKWS